MKLFLKGPRCVSEKCAFQKRAFSPGQHGQSRKTKLSDYGTQLREKQKVKIIYGLLERQFRNYFRKAAQHKGITGELLLQFLERRLDNVVFRAGFTASRSEARQIVSHGLITVNGKNVNVPSFLIKKDDVIGIKGGEEVQKKFAEALKVNKDRGIAEWLKIDEAQLSAAVTRLPERQDVGFPIQEQLIVELYSK